MYRRLTRVWTRSYLSYMPGFKEKFPELKFVTNKKLAERFKELNIDFFYEEKVPVPKYIRFTLPFALILMGLMFLFIPFLFLITGKWGYDLSDKNRILNWFRMLKLF